MARLCELLALALGYAATYLGIAALTVGYEYQLEWLEGGIVDEVGRALAGRQLYAPPRLEYVAYVYTPLYFYAAAATAGVLGLDLLAPRLLSLLATLGSTALIVAFVRKELVRLGAPGESWTYGLLSGGFFLATFDLTGKWFHLARVDSLALFLLLAGCHGIRFGRSPASAVASGFLLCAAFLTKQTALVAAVPMLAALLFTERRRALRVGGALAAALLVSSVGFELASGGWYRYFVFDLPRHHGIVPERWITFWTHDLLRVWIAVVGSILALLSLFGRDRGTAGFYTGLWIGFVGSSLVARVRPAGWINSLLPAAAALAITFPLAVALARTRSRPTRWGGVGRTLAGALLLVQLLLLAYDPRSAVPTEEDRRAGERLLRYVREIEGEVLIPQHRFLQTRVGKTSFALDMAADDVLRAPDHPARRRLLTEIQTAIRSLRFDAVILHDDGWTRRVPGFGEAYVFVEDLFGESPVYRPVVGYRMRPTRVHWRRDLAFSGSGTRSHTPQPGVRRSR